ncbi:hypothetical protein QEN19_000446 [Hanseniaspora menglaensis]
MKYNNIKVSYFLLKNLLIVCAGSLLFGYHMGELNTASKYITCQYLNENPNVGDGKCIPMNSNQFALVTSVFSIGGLVGSFLCANIADKHGRKFVCLINSINFVIGSITIQYSKNLIFFIIGRIILGISSGSSIVLTSLVISEIAPIELKDSLGTLNQAFINIGLLLVQCLSMKWAKPLVWKKLFYFSSFVSLFQTLIVFFFLDETPRWLRDNGYKEKAKVVSKKLGFKTLETSNFSQETIVEANNSLNHNSSIEPISYLPDQKRGLVGWKEYLTNKKYRTSVIFVTIILVGQQLSGINSIMLYSTQVITELSGKNGDSLAKKVNLLISVINVIFTCISPKAIDFFGTNQCLSISAFFMSFFSLMIAFSLQFKYLDLLIGFLVCFIIAFALGVGPIPFLIISGLTPFEARSTSQSFGTVNNWLGTFLVSYFFPVFSSVLGTPAVFAIFAFCSLGFSAIIHFKLPNNNLLADDIEQQRLLTLSG